MTHYEEETNYESRLEEIEDKIQLILQRQETTDIMFRTFDQKVDRILQLLTIQSSRIALEKTKEQHHGIDPRLREMMEELRMDVELLKRATVSEWEK